MDDIPSIASTAPVGSRTDPEEKVTKPAHADDSNSLNPANSCNNEDSKDNKDQDQDKGVIALDSLTHNTAKLKCGMREERRLWEHTKGNHKKDGAKWSVIDIRQLLPVDPQLEGQVKDRLPRAQLMQNRC